MRVLAVGASHRTVSVADLDRFARALARLRSDFEPPNASPPIPVQEICFLSTCNRVEVYTRPEQGRERDVADAVYGRVFSQVDRPVPSGALYELTGIEAVHHLCRVASGLDSMVLGEPQIAGQVARAFRGTIRPGGDGRTLAGLAAIARRASRRVRSRTELGRHSVSVGSVALGLVEDELGTLAGRRGVVVGAGKIGRLVSTVMRSSGLASLTVVNRSRRRLRALAERLGCDTASLDALPELLAQTDAVVTATDSPEPILSAATVRAAVAARGGAEPLYVVDLALPADVDAEVGALDGVRLFDLADVQRRLTQNVELRRQAVEPAEAVVEEVVRRSRTAYAGHAPERARHF